MSYKLKYKEALKVAGITEDDLLPKSKQAIKDLLQLQAVAESENNEDAWAALEALDSDLCKKIARNESYKANAAKMQAARKKKEVVVITPEPVVEEVKPTPQIVEEPKKKEDGGKVEEKESSAIGWIAGLGISAMGLLFIGKWQKWF